MAQLQREEVAELFALAAAELEKAAKHFRQASEHFRKGVVPSGCAHAFAAQGHLRQADETNNHASTIHAAYSLAST
jgi:1-aminocyclopropane-1-carboxylate deaminase/D-cysteine desulfhydrase-like pyridoxal-dependent ACC family enzyme